MSRAGEEPPCPHPSLCYGGGCWHCPQCGGAVDLDDLA